MLFWTQSLESLRKFCAEFWTEPSDCVRLLAQAGINSINISFEEPSARRWGAMLNEVNRMGEQPLVRFIAVLVSEYPENANLRSVCAPWIPSSMNIEAPIEKNGKQVNPSPAPFEEVKIPEVMKMPERKPEEAGPLLQAPPPPLEPEPVPTIPEQMPPKTEKPVSEPPSPSKADLVPVLVPREFQSEAEMLIERVNALLLIATNHETRLKSVEEWRKTFVPTITVTKPG